MMPRTAANTLTVKGSETRRPIRSSIMQVVSGQWSIYDRLVATVHRFHLFPTPPFFPVQPLCRLIQSGANDAEFLHAELQGRAVQSQFYRGSVRSGEHPSG